MRRLLVQAAVSMLRRRDPRTAELREWALGIAARRGKKVAVVALARRLAGILYAMLRDGTQLRNLPDISCSPATRRRPRYPGVETAPPRQRCDRDLERSSSSDNDVVGARVPPWPTVGAAAA